MGGGEILQNLCFHYLLFFSELTDLTALTYIHNNYINLFNGGRPNRTVAPNHSDPGPDGGLISIIDCLHFNCCIINLFIF